VQQIQEITYTITSLHPTNTDTTSIQHMSTDTNTTHKITDTIASLAQIQIQHSNLHKFSKS